jgi:hypothetical protein
VGPESDAAFGTAGNARHRAVRGRSARRRRFHVHRWKGPAGARRGRRRDRRRDRLGPGAKLRRARAGGIRRQGPGGWGVPHAGRQGAHPSRRGRCRDGSALRLGPERGCELDVGRWGLGVAGRWVHALRRRTVLRIGGQRAQRSGRPRHCDRGCHRLESKAGHGADEWLLAEPLPNHSAHRQQHRPGGIRGVRDREVHRDRRTGDHRYGRSRHRCGAGHLMDAGFGVCELGTARAGGLHPPGQCELGWRLWLRHHRPRGGRRGRPSLGGDDPGVGELGNDGVRGRRVHQLRRPGAQWNRGVRCRHRRRHQLGSGPPVQQSFNLRSFTDGVRCFGRGLGGLRGRELRAHRRESHAASGRARRGDRRRNGLEPGRQRLH